VVWSVREAYRYSIMCTCSDVGELVGVSSVGMCRKEWWRTPVGFVGWEYLCLLPGDDVGICICKSSACNVRGAGIIRTWDCTILLTFFYLIVNILITSSRDYTNHANTNNAITITITIFKLLH
jgi:hypothetical protein